MGERGGRARTAHGFVAVAFVLLAALVAGGCRASPGYRPLDRDRAPAACGWGNRDARMEWWYASGVDVERGLAFHVAWFLAWPPREWRVLGVPAERWLVAPVPIAHVGVTDLRTDAFKFEERWRFPWERTCESADPLRVKVGSWRLAEEGCGRGTGAGDVYRLDAGTVHVELTASKPRIVQGDGFSGNGRTGRMGYQSVTRLEARGMVGGRAFDGLVWMDHQWGDMMPGEGAVWDWAGLQCEDGTDLMLYRIASPDGKAARVTATVTDGAGRNRELPNVRIETTAVWTSRSGRTYPVGWHVGADGLAVDVEAMRLDQEMLSWTGDIAYWEGPVRFHGTLDARPIRGHGMAETLWGPMEGRPGGDRRAPGCAGPSNGAGNASAAWSRPEATIPEAADGPIAQTVRAGDS